MITQSQMQAIADEYYEQLDKPEVAKHKPQFCLSVIGLVGAGKTTVVKKICQKIPLVRHSGDEIREILYKHSLPVSHTFDVGRITTTRLKSEGYNVAHDNDFSRPEARRAAHELNEKLGITEVWIRVVAPEPVILDRLRNRPATNFMDNESAIKIYEKRKMLHASLPDLETLPYMYVFDTSRDDVDVQVDEFVMRARHKLGYTTGI